MATLSEGSCFPRFPHRDCLTRGMNILGELLLGETVFLSTFGDYFAGRHKLSLLCMFTEKMITRLGRICRHKFYFTILDTFSVWWVA